VSRRPGAAPRRAHALVVALWLASAAWVRADEQKTVVVVGGGYGGLEAATQLAKEKGTRVVLVDREATNARITHLPGFVAIGEQIETPFQEIARREGFDFVRGEVTGWDGAQKQVKLGNGRTLGYDAIIVAVGGKAATPASVPGTAEHAHGFRTLREARALRRALDEKLAQAKVDGRRLEVVIVGAGPSGIELAGAIARAHPQASVHLLQRGQHLKPFGDSTTPDEGDATATWLRGLGIKVSTGTSPRKIDARGVELHANGHGTPARIDADLVVATMGDVGAAAGLGATAHPQQRLNVGAFLQHPSHKDAYVIGDAAAIVDGATGQAVAQAAKKAKAQGELAAQNALRGLRGQPLVAYVDALKPSPPGGTGPGSRVQKFLEKHVGQGPLLPHPTSGARGR
jgi:NADH:ubiquinone reductase (H+-translocating)